MMKDDEPYLKHGFICFDRLDVVIRQVADFIHQNTS